MASDIRRMRERCTFRYSITWPWSVRMAEECIRNNEAQPHEPLGGHVAHEVRHPLPPRDHRLPKELQARVSNSSGP